VPALFVRSEGAAKRFIEYFTAHVRNVRNRNTRTAYFKAVSRFSDWCEAHGLTLETVQPVHVAAYVEELGHTHAKPTVGATPVLSAEEARTLLDSIDLSTIIDLCDRALIGLMVYSFARIEAAVSLKVEDFYPERRKWWVRLHEKGGRTARTIRAKSSRRP
jgi:site-specific recombinase XerD